MSNPQIYIFFDDVVREYQDCYGKESEIKLVYELKKHLSFLSRTCRISIITYRDVSDVANWFSKNDLHAFVETISNPQILLS